MASDLPSQGKIVFSQKLLSAFSKTSKGPDESVGTVSSRETYPEGELMAVLMMLITFLERMTGRYN